MGSPVVSGALLQCTMGVTPCSLKVFPINRVTFEGEPTANIMDSVGFVNIAGFSLCMSIANPITAAQTAAALGVLTPGTCTPTTTPWVPGSPTVLVAAFPAVNDKSQCVCAYGGTITVAFGAAPKETIP